jgi:hypothetical protein
LLVLVLVLEYLLVCIPFLKPDQTSRGAHATPITGFR